MSAVTFGFTLIWFSDRIVATACKADVDNDRRQRIHCMSKSEVVLVLGKLCGYSRTLRDACIMHGVPIVYDQCLSFQAPTACSLETHVPT